MYSSEVYKRLNEVLGTNYSKRLTINWDYIFRYYTLKEDFIRELSPFISSPGWVEMSSHQTLSEEFMDEFKNRLDWRKISRFQELSEDFIEKHKDHLDWSGVCLNQVLSPGFMDKHEEKVDMNIVSSCQYLPPWFLKKYKDRVNWSYVSSNQVMDPEFMRSKSIRRLLDWSRVREFQPFIDKSLYSFIDTNLLEKNPYYNLYQKTKECGRFFGFIMNGSQHRLFYGKCNKRRVFSINVDSGFPFTAKAILRWKDLKLIGRIEERNILYIRDVKYL